jgi:tetratricopeptide (TPR) repeat protein
MESRTENLMHEPDPGGNWHMLSLECQDKFLRTGNPSYIEKAIAYGKEAVETTMVDHHDYVRRRHDLAVCFHLDFVETGDRGKLQEAIDLIDETLAVTLDRHPDHAALLHARSVFLADRYARAGDDRANLDRAIEIGRRALEATPLDDPKRPERLRNLCASLEEQSRSTGDDHYIDEAICLGQEALDSLPEGLGERNAIRIECGLCFHHRFKRTGRSEDLYKAIELGRESLGDISEYHSEHMECTIMMLACLDSLFQRTDAPSYLDEALLLGQNTLDKYSKDDRLRGECLGRMGGIYLHRFSNRDDPLDLDKCIKVEKQVKEAKSSSRTTKLNAVHTLCLSFKLRYKKYHKMRDLEEAIKFGQSSLALVEPCDPDHAECLYALAGCYHERFQASSAGTGLLQFGKSMQDLHQSMILYREALYHETGLPMSRLKAGMMAALSLASLEHWHDCSTVFDQTLDLIPRVSPRTSSREDFQYTLRTLYGAGSLAAVAYLKAERSPREALQILERSRGVIAGFMVDSQTDFSYLKEEIPELHPELQSRLSNLRESLAQPLSVDTYVADTTRQSKYLNELEVTLEKIREQPGFERFLLSMTEKDILDLASSGPIVYFNISTVSAEAFLISQTIVEVLPLPELKTLNLEDLVSLLAASGARNKRDAKIILSSGLGQTESVRVPRSEGISLAMISIWDKAIRPVLDILGLLGVKKPGQRLPRIWWIGGGKLALLPLHAAGRHDPGSTENTISHVISSYAPTLKSLQFARSRPWKTLKGGFTKVLAVSMPWTPGIPGHLNTREEVEEIERAIASPDKFTALEQPSKSKVLEEFESSTICHFACHGRAHGVDPAKSCLLLGKTAVEELRIEDLDPIRHPKAQIAYLSACSTAETKLHALIDESIHLASAFLLIGFPHVIGTLWGAQDPAAVQVAKEFYRELFRTDSDAGTSVAYALHKAVVTLKNTDGNSGDILKWGTFIHIGS